MLTQQNMPLVKETITGLRVTKATVLECGDLLIILDMVKAAENLYWIYNEHMKQKQANKTQKEDDINE